MSRSERKEARALARRVAARIKANSDLYDQRKYVNECGSPCCVAGWTVFEVEGNRDDWTVGARFFTRCIDEDDEVCEYWSDSAVEVTAQLALGLTAGETYTMFDSNPYAALADYEEDVDPPTATEACAMLIHFADENEVKWPER